jgi:hypothetical protein
MLNYVLNVLRVCVDKFMYSGFDPALGYNNMNKYARKQNVAKLILDTSVAVLARVLRFMVVLSRNRFVPYRFVP